MLVEPPALSLEVSDLLAVLLILGGSPLDLLTSRLRTAASGSRATRAERAFVCADGVPCHS